MPLPESLSVQWSLIWVTEILMCGNCERLSSDSGEDIPSQNAREELGNPGPHTAKPGPAENGPRATEGGRQQKKGTFSKFVRPVTNVEKQAGMKASAKRKGEAA